MNARRLPGLGRLAAIALTVLACGCVSKIDVIRADKDSPGIHYYLPQVFIQVTPSPDGSFKVKTIYLPDPANRYAILPRSYLGKYTVDINRSQEGFLELVSFNSDNTGIAKQLITSEANLRAAEIETQAAKAKTDSAEAKAAAEKQAAAVAAAEKAQKDALLALHVAEARLSLLLSQVGTPGATDDLNKQILAARVAVAEAKVKYEESIVAANAAAANFAAANGPSKNAALSTPAPVFLKVVMTEDSVAMESPFAQQNLATWKIPSPAATAEEFALFPASLVARPAEKTGGLTAEVRSNRPLRSVAITSVQRLAPNPTVIPLAEIVVGLMPDRTAIRIDFPKAIPAGNYQIRGNFDIGTPSASEMKNQIIDIRIEK